MKSVFWFIRAAIGGRPGPHLEPWSVTELRAAARLIAALPDPRPTRRLVPRISTLPAWLAPLRTLTTLASGVSVFLFLATALLANVGSLASQSATNGLGGRRSNGLGGVTVSGLRSDRGEVLATSWLHPRRPGP